MTLEDLATQTPMIVPIDVRGYSHFVVVRDVTDRDVHVADPSFDNYRMKRPDFTGKWNGIGFEIRRRTGDK